MIQVFFAYAREDEQQCKKLVEHLSLLERSQRIAICSELDITAGQEREQEIKSKLNQAQIILLLISAGFLSSDFYWEKELGQAIERHEAGKARVIPVILKPVDWQDAPFAQLQVLPRNKKSVKDPSFSSEDEAFLEIAKEIREVVKELEPTQQPTVNKKNQISQLPKVCNFDLDELRDNCLDRCLERKAIIGFTIACDSDAFLYSFCERLKNEFDRSNTLIKEPLSLSPKLISVKEAIRKIVRYKGLLATKNVICPVRIQVFRSYEDSSNISQQFWQSLCDEISEKFKYSLIVVMTGSEDSIFPSSDSAITLEPPQFRPAHVYRWIRDIVQRLEWADSIIDEWRQLMMDECCDNNSLDVRYVYEHLSESLQLLQQNPSAEAESFLRELKQRNQQLYA
jgi:hypothetical protein